MTATQTTKQPASDSVVIKAINDEPGLRKEWRNLSETQKRRVLESAKGCTDAVCLMRSVSEARIEQIPLKLIEVGM